MQLPGGGDGRRLSNGCFLFYSLSVTEAGAAVAVENIFQRDNSGGLSSAEEAKPIDVRTRETRVRIVTKKKSGEKSKECLHSVQSAGG